MLPCGRPASAGGDNMRTSVKIALAGSLGGVLLVGGAGSLAYWQDGVTAPGRSLGSGTLEFTSSSCPSWTYVGGTGPAETVASGDLLVPGDSVVRDCTYVITAKGAHVGAELEVTQSAATVSPGLDDELDVASEITIVGGSYATPHVIAPGDGPLDLGAGTYEVHVSYTVDFPFGTQADNDSRNGSAVIPDVRLQVTQTEPA